MLSSRIGCVAVLCAIVGAGHAQQQGRWVGSWASSQQVPETNNALPKEDLNDATLRQIVRLSLGGQAIRLHLSNAFGLGTLRINSVHVARPLAAGKIDPATDLVVSFNGHADVSIPPGAEYLSDAIPMPATALSSVAITMYLATGPWQQTGHPGSRANSYITHGNVVSAAELPSAKAFQHWTMLSGVDVFSSPSAFALVALGDSITDGHASTIDGNNRWTDALAERLQAKGSEKLISVLNEGIGGNHLLTDGLGPNVLARFDRDVLAQPGIRTVIVLEGVNDLGALARETNVTPEQHAARVFGIEGAYQQVIDRAHAHGLKVIGATILPYTGSDYYHPAAADEADRQLVNAWIRAADHFDAVVDFDQIMADPKDRTRLLPAYDCGDHLHPSPAGYKAMADAIPLTLLSR